MHICEREGCLNIPRKRINKFCSRECAYIAQIGVPLTAEHKRSISLGNKKRFKNGFSDEHKEKLKEARNKRPPASPETRAKISASLMGNKRALGHKQSSEAIEKKRQKWLGKKHSMKTRKRMSEVQSGDKHWAYGTERTEEQKIAQSKRMKGKNNPFYGKRHDRKTRAIMKAKAALRPVSSYDNWRAARAKTGFEFPNYNPRACKWFEEFDQFFGTNGQHAEKGGEKLIEKLGYWVDYFNPELKMIIEWNEEYHYRGGKLKRKYVEREKSIQELYPQFCIIQLREKNVLKHKEVLHGSFSQEF